MGKVLLNGDRSSPRVSEPLQRSVDPLLKRVNRFKEADTRSKRDEGRSTEPKPFLQIKEIPLKKCSLFQTIII